MTMKTLSENTLIPIGFVIVLIGGGSFITNIYFQTSASAKAIEEIRVKQDSILEIQTDIAVIKKSIEGIEKRLK